MNELHPQAYKSEAHRVKMEYVLRPATEADLPAINQVIETAVMSWQLPERVKRLSLPSYRYDATDLMHLTLWLAENDKGEAVAIAGWEAADATDLSDGLRGILLHGLYVLPDLHGHGLGQSLLALTERNAKESGYDGILVKAQTEAIGFFQRQGYGDLPVEDDARHYSHRMWKNINH